MSSSKLVQQLLTQRGIPLEEQDAFLNPNFERDLFDGASILGMDKAVQRLQDALSRNEKVLIFGDYDADGVPATALLLRALKPLGMNVEGIIPRRDQGYGLSESIVQELIAQKPGFVLTVDNGTVAKQEIANLTAAGIDVLVCDHHEPQIGEVADTAIAVLNPKQADCPYPFKEMCACGLAWKLADQLYKTLGKNRESLKWELDLVALSTIADMVPLVGENRVLATFGLKVMRKSRNVGIKALAESAGLDLSTCSAGDIGFKIAPRINAPSRMHAEMVESAHASLALLTSDDAFEAKRLATYLNQQNGGRQSLVDTHLADAEAQAKDCEDVCLVVYNESWSTGVIGLVAGRLLEQYKRPVIALAPEGGVIKGSVRTVDGVHALEMLEAVSQHLDRFGGHSKAAGLSLKGDVDEFRRDINAWLCQHTDLQQLAAASERTADLTIQLDDISLDLCSELELLEPCGIGFPTPVFEAECTVRNPRKVGSEGQHLSLFLEDGQVQRKGIAFRWRGQADEGKRYVARFTIGAEEWRSVRSPVCYIRSLIPAEE